MLINLGYICHSVLVEDFDNKVLKKDKVENDLLSITFQKEGKYEVLMPILIKDLMTALNSLNIETSNIEISSDKIINQNTVWHTLL